MRPRSRRAATLLAVPTLVLAGLAVSGSPAAADPAPPATAVDARDWLAGQLEGTGWIVHNQQYDYDDYGLTIDAGIALHTAGASDEVVGEVSDAVAAHLDDYTRPVAYGTNLSAGGSAKALVLAQAAGDDPTSYGGRDVVADLESTVATEAPITGRIQDDWDHDNQYAGDYANVIGQAYAVEGLDAAGSTDTDAVTDFLLEQQCSAGFFRQSFAAADAADQSCDGGDGAPSVDTTAIAVRALQSQVDDTDIASRVDDAVAWLMDQQKANGGFGSDADITTANANSTGVAAYALSVTGHPKAAARAAAWLRAHQAANVASCASFDDADLGAVVYDDAARTSAQAGPMDGALTDQSVRATVDALAGLLAAPAGSGDPNVLSAPGYVKAGGRTSVGVNDAAPGAPLCAMLGEQSVIGWADPAGDASLRVRVPAKPGKSTVKVADSSGRIGTATLHSLGAKKLSLSLKKARVSTGGRQVVIVRGLAAGEPASVRVTWPTGKHGGSATARVGQASRKGVLRATFRVPQKHRGTAKVRAFGQFRDRVGVASFVVTR